MYCNCLLQLTDRGNWNYLNATKELKVSTIAIIDSVKSWWLYTSQTPPKEPTDVVTSHCDVMTSRHDITCHHISWQSESAQVNRSETPKSHFSTWRHWPLTYDLDTQTCSRYCQDTPPYQLSCPYVERFSSERALTDGQTHRWTDRRVRIYTLDRWRGREKPNLKYHCHFIALFHWHEKCRLVS